MVFDVTKYRTPQYAIDDAANHGGGVVEFPPGTFVVQGLVLQPNVLLQGSHRGATILTLPDHANGDLITTAGFAGLTGGTSSGGPANWGIRNMVLDGNKAGQSSGPSYPLRIYGKSFLLEHLVVRNGYSGGIWSEWGTAAAIPFPGYEQLEALLSDVLVHENNGEGIHWLGPHDSRWMNTICWQNGAANGIYLGPNAGGTQVVNSHVWGTNHLVACYCEATGAFFSNCDFEGASSTIFVLAAHDISLADSLLFTSGVTTATVLQVGDTGKPAIGCRADVRINVDAQAAINFIDDGGWNNIRAQIFGAGASALAVAGTIHPGTWYALQLAAGPVPDGTLAKGGGQRLALTADAAWQIADASGTNIARFDTRSKILRLVNGTAVAVYADDGVTIVGSFDGGGNVKGNVFWGASTAAGAIGNNYSVNPLTDSFVLAPTGAVTGFAVASGFFDDQKLTVVNNSAFTVTPAVEATSKIKGAGVIAANSARRYTYVASVDRWFPQI